MPDDKIENETLQPAEPTESTDPQSGEAAAPAQSPETSSPETPDTEPEQSRKNGDDRRFNQNRVFLRGTLRGIRQELDNEDRQNNVITITTPNPKAGGIIETGYVDVYWGSNTRAGEILREYTSGDHVIIEAECRTYMTDLSRGEVLYGLSISRDKPAGITGLGDYEPDRNEAFFVGTLRAVRRVSDTMDLLHLAIHTVTDGREISSYPMIGITGRASQTFRRNASRFTTGNLIGLACHIQLRPDKSTGQQRIRWQVHGLLRVLNNGATAAVRIPPSSSYRAPRNNGSRTRVQQTVRSSAADDLNHIRTDQEDSSTEPPAAADVPAAELEPKPAVENEELIEYHPEEKTAEVLTGDRIRELARQQALQALGSGDDDTE